MELVKLYFLLPPGEESFCPVGLSSSRAVKGDGCGKFKIYGRLGAPWWLSAKESTCQCRRCRRLGFDPWVRKIPWKREWQPIPVFLPEKSHGQRSLVGYSWWNWRVRCDWVPTHSRLEDGGCIWYQCFSTLMCTQVTWGSGWDAEPQATGLG